MKKAKLIICQNGNRVIKEVEGDGSHYYPGHLETVLSIKVRPATKQDHKKAYDFLGIDIDEIHPRIRKAIKEQLSYIEETNIAESFTNIDGKWHYSLYYEVIKTKES